MSKAGREILGAMQEFKDALDSGEPLERRFTSHHYVIDAEPPVYDGAAIRRLRDSFGMSQGVFAGFLCVAPSTVRSWERGQRDPLPIARRLMGEMAASPEHFRERFACLATLKARPASESAKRPVRIKTPRKLKAPFKA